MPANGPLASIFSWLGIFPESRFVGDPQQISEALALNFAAVWRAVTLISGSIASLPLQPYKLAPNGDKMLDRENQIYPILHDRPNSEMTRFTWESTLTLHMLLWGNGRAFIERDKGGNPIALWPIQPEQVTVERDEKTRRIVYAIKVAGGVEPKRVEASEVIDVPYLSTDGVTGYAPIALARTTLGAMMAAEEFAKRFWNNAAMPSGVLTVEKQLTDEQTKRLRESFQSRQAGSDNAGLTMILQNGMKWAPVTMPLNDAQFLESRVFQVEEIARWFGLPDYWLTSKNQGGPSVEQRAIELVTFTLRPHLIRIEQELNRKLFPDGSVFAEHNVDALLRADALTRAKVYQIATGNAPYMTPNEVRRKENLESMPDGDSLTKEESQPQPEPVRIADAA